MNDIDIKLPPLHYDELPEIPEDIVVCMQSYARAAIEADRKRRGEPTKEDYFGTYDNDDCMFNLRGFYSNERELIDKGLIIPLYLHPQPADKVRELERFIELAFEAHPNLDLDIEAIKAMKGERNGRLMHDRRYP